MKGGGGHRPLAFGAPRRLSAFLAGVGLAAAAGVFLALSACGGEEPGEEVASGPSATEWITPVGSSGGESAEGESPSGEGSSRADGAGGEAPGSARGGDQDAPACRREGRPCTWAEVAPEVVERSRSLARDAFRRLEGDSAAAVEGWLRDVEGVAEAGSRPGRVWFRLEDGRRIWVYGDAPYGGGGASSPGTAETSSPRGTLLSGLLPRSLHAAEAGAAGRTAGAPSAPYMAGRDRTGDRKLNQRDRRRALVLDPFRTSFGGSDASDARLADVPVEEISGGYVEGTRIARILRERGGYEVDYLADGDAHVGAFMDWDEYDVIHLSSHGDPWSWVTGEQIDWETWDVESPGERGREPVELLNTLRLMGLEAAMIPLPAEDRLGWFYAVNEDFVRLHYPQGLDRTVLYLSSCSSARARGIPPPGMIRSILGERSMVVGWRRIIDDPWGQRAAVTFWRLASRGLNGGEIYERLQEAKLDVPGRGELSAQDGILVGRPVLRAYGNDLRIREIVTLHDPDPNPASTAGAGMSRPLRDGTSLFRLLDGAPGDGRDDRITALAAVEVPAIPEDRVDATEVHLELDGEPVGEPRPLAGASRSGDRYRLRFEDVSLGRDVEGGRVYDLEAVVSLPEGGESRYSVRGIFGGWYVEVRGAGERLQASGGGGRVELSDARPSAQAFSVKLLPAQGEMTEALAAMQAGGEWEMPEVNLGMRALSPGTERVLRDPAFVGAELATPEGRDRFGGFRPVTGVEATPGWGFRPTGVVEILEFTEERIRGRFRAEPACRQLEGKLRAECALTERGPEAPTFAIRGAFDLPLARMSEGVWTTPLELPFPFGEGASGGADVPALEEMGEMGEMIRRIAEGEEPAEVIPGPGEVQLPTPAEMAAAAEGAGEGAAGRPAAGRGGGAPGTQTAAPEGTAPGRADGDAAGRGDGAGGGDGGEAADGADAAGGAGGNARSPEAARAAETLLCLAESRMAAGALDGYRQVVSRLPDASVLSLAENWLRTASPEERRRCEP